MKWNVREIVRSIQSLYPFGYSDGGQYGDASDGNVTNITDVDIDGSKVAQTATVTLTSDRIIRSKADIAITQAITVSKQDGQARGLFPPEDGSSGVELGAIMAALGTHGIPAPIRPGGGNTALCGGVVQLLAKGNVSVGSTITATGTNTTSDGGGGGGLVVIISGGTISGSSAIDVSGSDGHGTAAAEAGAGSYSGVPGGHAGIGGSGGGSGGWNVAPGGAGGAGGQGYMKGGYGGSPGGTSGGAGGGSLDNVGVGNGGKGGDGDGLLAMGIGPFGFMSRDDAANAMYMRRPIPAQSYPQTVDQGGTNGGGGYQGGAAQSTDPVGSGGGGGPTQVPGGNGSAGSPYLWFPSSQSPYAGQSGGMGGGGGGGGGRGPSAGGPGSGAAGATTVAVKVTGMGAGQGGAGGAGADGYYSGGPPGYGGAGGDGGNGGGAAGLVLMIGTSITYSGTVTGRLIKIEGADADHILRGNFNRGN